MAPTRPHFTWPDELGNPTTKSTAFPDAAFQVTRMMSECSGRYTAGPAEVAVPGMGRTVFHFKTLPLPAWPIEYLSCESAASFHTTMTCPEVSVPIGAAEGRLLVNALPKATKPGADHRFRLRLIDVW